MANDFKYEYSDGRTTQWDDIQRKMGNLPPKEPVKQTEPWTPDKEEQEQAWLQDASEDQVEGAEDLTADDRFLEEYRQKRLAELHAAQQQLRPSFGSVQHITGGQFVQEVTHAGPDVWVVVHLFKEGVSECGLLQQCLEVLAERHPHTKFLKSVSTDCIPRYPDRNLPTVLIYKDTKCIRHLIGLGPFGGSRLTPERVALTLNHFGPICRAEGERDTPLDLQDVQAYIEELVLQQASAKQKHQQESSSEVK